MSYQTTFQRYELKYLLTGQEKEAILFAMQPFMRLDDYGRTTIRNLYLDTDNFRLIRRSLEKPVYKEKLRIRTSVSYTHLITLHSKIKVRVSKDMPDGTGKSGTIDATLGRLLFNEIIPQDLGFVDREVEGNELLLEVDFHVGKKQLKQILEKVINTHGATQTAEVLDDVKAIGYKFSTRAAMTCLLYTSRCV